MCYLHSDLSSLQSSLTLLSRPNVTLLAGVTFLSNTRALATQLVSQGIMKKLRISNDSATWMQNDASMYIVVSFLPLQSIIFLVVPYGWKNFTSC